MKCRRLARVMVLAGLVGVPAVASAQGVALGPRFSFVRGDIASGGASTRFLGGTMRVTVSRRFATEVALDHRTFKSADRTTRVRETPFQGSLLIFFAHSTFSPYVVGGVGSYGRQFDQLAASGKTTGTTFERRTGVHLGVGAEIRLSPHAALFGDYRYRFVTFNGATPGGQPIIPGLDKLKLSHQGSMWTSGVAFYF